MTSPLVLVVDDDPDILDAICDILGAEGYPVARARHGVEALEQVARQRPDLILLDLMMPDVSGFEVVDLLRGDAATADIPIIVVTARQLTAEDRAALNGCVAAVLEKASFNHGRFIAEVRRALHRRTRS